MSPPGPRPVPDGIAAYLERQRWFAGKGRPFTVQGLHALGQVHDDPTVEICLLDVDEAGVPVRYQLLLEHRGDLPERLRHAVVGVDPEGSVVDALHDRDVTGSLLRLITEQARVGAVTFHHLEGAPIPLDAPSLVMTAEQSNTSLVFGDAAVLKVYRRVTPDQNPDVEVHVALAGVGCEHIARPLGWVDAADGTLAFLQEFLVGGTEGWDMALGSVRDLFVEADLHPEECGGDFAGEAERLGAATAEVHAALRRAFPTARLTRDEVEQRVRLMQRRLDEVVAEVPALRPHASGLRETYEVLARSSSPLDVQRVHGDLHLGQTMRTSAGWRLLDFEGEPASPADLRRTPDTPLRDVAGMLRSIDYAPHVVLLDHPPAGQLAYRADEWAARNRAAFLRGYAEATGRPPEEDGMLVRALETEKAVYEVLYESRMRPSWLPIPLAAVERLAAG